MMEEDHQVEIKQLYNISFDKGKECQIPEKLVGWLRTGLLSK